MTNNPGFGVLALEGPLTIRQAATLKEQLLAGLATADAVALEIAATSEADLSFIQLVESARLHASLHDKQLRLSRPVEGQVRETLERAGLTAAMSPESREFWLHEKEIR